MRWTESICDAINYIEDNILEDLTIDDIAKHVMLSPYYFQKGFAMLCGLTVGEYIRLRRLTLAGSELVSTDQKIIDIALKYGYDSPGSFTKSFTRFHGVTPTAVRKDGTMVKSFAPLQIQLILKGGYIMDYKITKKEQFTIIGLSKKIKYDDALQRIPKFWNEIHQKEKRICGMFGVCIDESKSGNEFEYMVADHYNPIQDIPEGLTTKVIPEQTWAIFPCVGALPQSLQIVNEKIFSNWLPNCKDYEIAAGYNIEMYSNPNHYAKGTGDENYYSEVWIPVRQRL